MPQSTYISSTDPSGALLPDLQQLLYTNFDPSYIPTFGNTYLLKDFQSETYFYKSMSEKSVEIAKGFDNETKLINLIDSL